MWARPSFCAVSRVWVVLRDVLCWTVLYCAVPCCCWVRVVSVRVVSETRCESNHRSTNPDSHTITVLACAGGRAGGRVCRMRVDVVLRLL